MIVDPDFFDHWRTRMVVDMLGGDALAPVYIMRLWAHCQNRKSDTFAIPPSGIKALCHFGGDAQALEDALIAAEYLARDGQQVTVVGWAQKNAQLIAAWENGARGGRPKKEPLANREESHWAPEENPRETHGKPTGNPTATETKPIREDKRREEEKTEDKAQAPLPDWLPMEAWTGFVEMRKRIRKPMTTRAQQLVLKALEDMRAKGLSVAQALDNSTRNSWVDVYAPKDAAAATGAAKPGTDEYAAQHKTAGWWREAGFDTVWDAMASKCWHTNAHQFRDGKRVEVAA